MRFVLVLGTEFLDVFLQYSHWCRNIKPQQHQSAENRVGYNGREYGDRIDKEQLERSTVKIHQLFVLSYLCNVLKYGPKPLRSLIVCMSYIPRSVYISWKYALFWEFERILQLYLFQAKKWPITCIFTINIISAHLIGLTAE